MWYLSKMIFLVNLRKYRIRHSKTSMYKKIKFVLIILVALTITFSGCTKDGIDPSAPAVVVKYEIVSSDLVLGGSVGSSNYNVNVYYTNESGVKILESVNKSFKTWTKQVTVNASQRPITVMFDVSGFVESLSANVIINVYENDSLRGTFVCPVRDIGFPAFLFDGEIDNIKIK